MHCPRRGRSVVRRRGACDVAEACDGVSNAVSGGRVSRIGDAVPVGGRLSATVAENCTGSSAACPANGFVSSGTVCRSAVSVCERGRELQTERARPVRRSASRRRPRCAAARPARATSPRTAGARVPPVRRTRCGRRERVLCRSGVSTCDVAEACTGRRSVDCPADAFRVDGGRLPVVRRCPATWRRNCTGSSTDLSGRRLCCVGDAVPLGGRCLRRGRRTARVRARRVRRTGSCRRGPSVGSATGVCGRGRELHGSSAACPTDTSCRRGPFVARPCQRVRRRRELHRLERACPTDGFASSATVCRSSTGICDVAENCTGSSVACPADAFASSATTCRSAAGVCDLAENCTGSKRGLSVGREEHGRLPLGRRSVRPVGELRWRDQTRARRTRRARPCVGRRGRLRFDGKAAAASSNDCPAERQEYGGCAGRQPACAIWRRRAAAQATTVRRTRRARRVSSAAGVCDLADSCDGHHGCRAMRARPTASFASGTVCRSAGSGSATWPRGCTGASTACPSDGFASSGTVCRSAVSACATPPRAAPARARRAGRCRRVLGNGVPQRRCVCDLAETCNGICERRVPGGPQEHGRVPLGGGRMRRGRQLRRCQQHLSPDAK
jgi:hypothetical protein